MPGGARSAQPLHDGLAIDRARCVDDAESPRPGLECAVQLDHRDAVAPFGQGGITFQLLDNPYLFSTFCETCQ